MSLAALDRRVTDLCLQFQGSVRYERTLFIPSEANLAALDRQAAALEEEVRATVGADPIWQGHLLEILDVLRFRLLEDQRFPWRFLSTVSGFLDDLTAMDSRPVAERASVLQEKLSQAPDLFPALLRLIKRLGPARREQVQEYAIALQRVLATAQATTAGWGHAGVTHGLDALADSLSRFLLDMEAVGAAEQLPDLPFGETLHRAYGVDLADLLAWSDDEVARRQEELLALASRLSPGKTPFAILEEELPAYPAPELMFEPMRHYVAIAREACRGLISLPQGEECEVADVPEPLKRSYPWGGFSGGNPLLGSLKGQVFLNSANYTAVTKGWLEMMAVHECYPGHHAQRVKVAASDLPESYKLGGFRMARAVPLNEGIAHRSEELFQDLFPDRAYPLFVKLRQLHTAVRIKAELSMHYYGRPRSEAVDLYVRYLDFSRQSADGQVRYGEIWPGYFCCYYYGHKQLERLKAKYSTPEPAFTELTFSCGYVSLQTVEALMAFPKPAC